MMLLLLLLLYTLCSDICCCSGLICKCHLVYGTKKNLPAFSPPQVVNTSESELLLLWNVVINSKHCTLCSCLILTCLNQEKQAYESPNIWRTTLLRYRIADPSLYAVYVRHKDKQLSRFKSSFFAISLLKSLLKFQTSKSV